MPSASVDEDDPVIASYDVCLTNPSISDDVSSKLMVLQYPSHRKATLPYNAASGQQPKSLKLKAKTGMVEMEIPIASEQDYNRFKSEKYGATMAESRVAHPSGNYGLAGGFSNGPGPALKLHEIPQHGEDTDHPLKTQTLGGKIAFPTQRDPIYMLGVFRNDEIYLSPVDALVQMRPQFHYIDAEVELSHKKERASAGTGKVTANLDTGPVKLETKAIEMKMKDSKEDPKNNALNDNAKLLRHIQAEPWKEHEWIDEGHGDSLRQLETRVMLQSSEGTASLQSMIGNDEWLDKMSAPREDGKKSLRSKLKGRDRERARRKKIEDQRRRPSVATAPVEVAEISSDTDASSSDQSDEEMADPTEGLDGSDIKQEPSSLAAAPAQAPKVPDPLMTADAAAAGPKRRGRPKKNAD